MRSPNAVRIIRSSTAIRLSAAIILGGAGLGGCSDSSTVGPANLAAPFSGSGVSGMVATADSTPLVVIVTDADGHGIGGVAITFVASAGVSLASTSAVTDNNGLASTKATFGTKAGTDSVTATAAGLPTPPAIFFLTATPGPASAIVAEAGNNQSAPVGSDVQLIALVTDQYGNPVPDVKVDWTATAGSLAAVVPADSTGTADDVLQLPPTPTTVTATATIDGTAIKASFIDMSM